MNKEIKTRIKNKRDTNLNWTNANPILLDGELIIIDHETEGLKIKIGDGINSYDKLNYFNAVYSGEPVYSYAEIQRLDNAISRLETMINSVQTIPSGMIMIWSGSQIDIPEGWVLCDGTNNTPDLTDKFVLGAGGTYNIGDVGGEATHTLTVEEMPTHTHTYKRHAFDRNDTGEATGEDVYGANNKTLAAYMGTSESTGGGQAHNNMPPYYALCYIMKI